MRPVKLMSRSLIRVVALAMAGILASPAAYAVTTLGFAWKGQIAGLGVKGQFSFDETKTPNDGVIRKGNLLSFDVSFYNAQGGLLRTYANNHLSYAGFNFNYDTKTKKILQSGRWNSPNGIDIGYYFKDSNNKRTGMNFWSGPNHVHFDDFDDAFKLPRAFGGHKDVAFFTRTTRQLSKFSAFNPVFTNKTNFPLDAVGARMTITTPAPVPLPPTLALLFGGVALVGAVARKRR